MIVTRFSPRVSGERRMAIIPRPRFWRRKHSQQRPTLSVLQSNWLSLKPWQATRLVWNTSPFFFTNRNLPFDPTGSNAPGDGRLRSASWQSVHGNRGGQYQYAQEPGRRRAAATGGTKEYFKPLKGQPMTSSLFEGVDTTWSRVPRFGIRCSTNFSAHFEVQSRRSGCVGTSVVKVTADDKLNSGSRRG